jgi:hypothetical protein
MITVRDIPAHSSGLQGLQTLEFICVFVFLLCCLAYVADFPYRNPHSQACYCGMLQALP